MHQLVTMCSCSCGALSAGPLVLLSGLQDVTHCSGGLTSEKPAPFYVHVLHHALQVPVAARKRQLLQTTAAPSGLDLTNFAQNGLQNTVSS